MTVVQIPPEVDRFLMHPGETYVADECGCRIKVDSGPRDPTMAKQAPVCCCGNSMRREGAPGSTSIDERRPSPSSEHP